MFWAEYEKYQSFLLSENFHFLVVKFSIYLNMHVFVMNIIKTLNTMSMQTGHYWFHYIRREMFSFLGFFFLFFFGFFCCFFFLSCSLMLPLYNALIAGLKFQQTTFETLFFLKLVLIFCKFSPEETICMKCQSLFSWVNKKNIIKMSSAE